jgi:hypothetical protein
MELTLLDNWNVYFRTMGNRNDIRWIGSYNTLPQFPINSMITMENSDALIKSVEFDLVGYAVVYEVIWYVKVDG